MKSATSKRLLLETALWIAAVTCFSALGAVQLQAHVAAQAADKLSADATNRAGLTAASAAAQNHQQSHNGEVIGRLDIPELKLSVPILAGYEATSLRRGVGHIDGTAMPGGLGTVGLAGHRDTYFRKLRHITPEMKVSLTDSTGVYEYQVESTEIVNPSNVDVIAISSKPSMTLITCYPFDYIGAAPLRFIVHAHLLSLIPESSR